MPKRILVTGSREWTDYGTIASYLGHYAEHGDTLVHGACEFGGADELAEKYWLANDIGPVDPHPAQKGDAFGSKSDRYKKRNQHMVNLGADICISFAKDWGSGTGQCARMARRAGIPVVDAGVSTE